MYGYYIEIRRYQKGEKKEKTIKYKNNPWEDRGVEYYDTYDEALVAFKKVTYCDEEMKAFLSKGKSGTKFFDLPERPEVNEWYTDRESQLSKYFQRIEYRIRRVQRKKVI